jgi:hypothetical protein
MKKTIVLLFICFVAVVAAKAQKWEELSDEQKVSKLKDFRADNQKYLKNTLGMTQTQMDDIDNVNICYLSTLDRIKRYAKTDEAKEQLAEALTDARSKQLDAIMGADKRAKYMEYIKGKIEKAKNKTASN